MATAPTSRRLNLTRDQLATFLTDQQQIRQFELLFSTVDEIQVITGTDFEYQADTAAASANNALAQISALAQVAVTNVTGVAPVVSSGGKTPAISMAAASTSVDGYLTSTDWNTFNGKQPAGAYITATSTDTLTNKRITPRVSTTTSSATPTINTDNVDMYGLTAQAVNITSFTTNLSGTPTDGQKLHIYIVGTAARAITWGSAFEASTTALPTTTVTTNRLDIGFVWNAATSKWRCLASA
jgi:hypothetical protein